MDRSHRAQSTAPSARSQEEGEDARILALRWVFPAMDGPTFSLSPARIVLGREDTCQIRIPGTETSRHHAEVRRDGPLVIIRDLGSTNGVHIGGRRIAEAPLGAGDVLRLGEWVGVVVETAGSALDGTMAFGSFAEKLYAGPTMRAALEPALKAAASGLPVVLQGETGTGKERVARAIHAWSGRTGPFVAVNCAALPESLAEAELFGYRRGAFTGADRASPGHFRAAHGGSLLLDEIADLSQAVQAKLLRVLEEREVLPLGESRPVPVDVRVIVASQDPLIDRVDARRFRADLFARLEGLTVRLPPLRERIDEVPYLFARFLQEHSSGKPPAVEPQLIEALCLYDWPFNVRELDLVVRRLLTLHDHAKALRRSHLPERMLAHLSGKLGIAADAPHSTSASHAERRDQELARLVDALREHRGNVARAAAAAGLSRQRAYRLLEATDDIDLTALRAETRGVGNRSGDHEDHGR